MEVTEPSLPQRPQDSQALRRPVLLGAQHLQVLWEDRTQLGKSCNKAWSHGTSSTQAPSPWEGPRAPGEARNHSGRTPNPAPGVQGCWVGQAEPTGDTRMQ